MGIYKLQQASEYMNIVSLQGNKKVTFSSFCSISTISKTNKEKSGLSIRALTESANSNSHLGGKEYTIFIILQKNVSRNNFCRDRLFYEL